MNIFEAIERYQPYNEQEQRDRELLLSLNREEKDVFTRKNQWMHFTASSWIMNKERTKVLLAYHLIYDSWAWLGGHADGEENLLNVALKEAKEESGLQKIRVVNPEIFSLEILTVDGHEKKGEYIPSHLHLNVTYLLEADESECLQVNTDENKALQWFKLDEAIAASNEKWFQERIYPKLNEKVKKLIFT